jgi:V8-like Glu-specific endopeptidase
MLKYLTRFFILALIVGNSNVFAQTVYAIGDGSRYGCLVYDNETFLALKKNGSFVGASFTQHIRQTRNRLVKLLSSSNMSVSKKRKAISYWRTVLKHIRQCQSGTLNTWVITDDNSSGGGTSGGGTIGGTDGGSNNGGSGGGGSGTGSNQKACEIIEAPSLADITPRLISPRIINGEICGKDESPIVQLAITLSNGQSGSCTGTVISDTRVVTAAHCLATNLQGLPRVTRVVILTGLRQIEANQYEFHPNWSPQNNPLELNDIAIVATSSSIGTSIVPVLRSNNLQTGETALIAGYGLTESLVPEGLRAGFITLNSISSVSIIASWNGNVSGSNSCNGDSGGPLLVKRGDVWYLAGITSNGNATQCGVTEGSDVSRWTNITNSSNLSFIDNRL